MADTMQTLGLLTLAQAYNGDIVRFTNRAAMAIRVLKIVPGQGLNAAWATEGDGALVETYGEGADATNFGSDSQSKGILPWGLYRAPFHVTKLAMDAAGSSSTPEGNRALWARNMINSTEKLASKLNQDIYAGNGTGGSMVGLGLAIGTTNNVYAGNDRTILPANALWVPNINDPGTPTAITFAALRNDLRLGYINGGENPDIALCAPDVFNTIGGLYDTNRRYVQEITTAKGQVSLDAGFGGLELDGCVFLKDKDATPGSIFYLNTRYVELQYLPPVGQPQSLVEYLMQASDGMNLLPLSFDYQMLARVGASERAEITSTLQLVVKRPNACVVRKNVLPVTA